MPRTVPPPRPYPRVKRFEHHLRSHRTIGAAADARPPRCGNSVPTTAITMATDARLPMGDGASLYDPFDQGSPLDWVLPLVGGGGPTLVPAFEVWLPRVYPRKC